MKHRAGLQGHFQQWKAVKIVVLILNSTGGGE